MHIEPIRNESYTYYEVYTDIFGFSHVYRRYIYIYTFVCIYIVHYVRVCPYHFHQAGEKKFQWVLQNGEDTASRKTLPSWVGTELEVRICKFVSDHNKWEEVKAKRESMGRTLTKSQQDSYNAFLASVQQKLIFNKKKKLLVDDVTQIKRNLRDCFAFTLHLSDEPENLKVTTGNSDSFRLILLQGKTDAIEGLPDVLDQPIVQNDVSHHDVEPEESVRGDDEHEHIEDMTEQEIQALEHDKFEAEQGLQNESDDLDDILQVLGDSDDDLSDMTFQHGGVTKVKSFMFRDAWKKLESQSLTELPRHIKGVWIGYHQSSQQWQGSYPGSVEVMSCTWGKTTKRSETEAILRTIRNILKAHMYAHPKDKLWERQLCRVQDAELAL